LEGIITRRFPSLSTRTLPNSALEIKVIEKLTSLTSVQFRREAILRSFITFKNQKGLKLPKSSFRRMAQPVKINTDSNSSRVTTKRVIMATLTLHRILNCPPMKTLERILSGPHRCFIK
jgi:hypothetical protein